MNEEAVVRVGPQRHKKKISSVAETLTWLNWLSIPSGLGTW